MNNYDEILKQIKNLNAKIDDIIDSYDKLGVKKTKFNLKFNDIISIMKVNIEKEDAIDFMAKCLTEISKNEKIGLIEGDYTASINGCYGGKFSKANISYLKKVAINEIFEEEKFKVTQLDLNLIKEESIINYIIKEKLEDHLKKVSNMEKIDIVHRFSNSICASNIVIYKILDKLYESKDMFDYIVSNKYRVMKFNNLYKKTIKYHKLEEFTNINKITTYIKLLKD